ncbi:MAG: hypothetical protein ACOC4M_11025 [Promethearchaeia archaeon]
MIDDQFTSNETVEKAQSLSRLTDQLAHNKIHKGAFREKEKDFYEVHKDEGDRYFRISQYYYNVRQRLGQASREKIWGLLREWTNGEYLSGGDMLASAQAGKIGYVSNEPGEFDPSKFSGMLPQVLKRVMFLAKGDVSHEHLQELILKDPWMKKFFIGMEISVWVWSGDKETLLTEHLDLIFLIDGALYYFEYKPGDAQKPDSDQLSKHLFQSIPQGAAGALTLMSLIAGERRLSEDLTIDIPVYCVSFNLTYQVIG